MPDTTDCGLSKTDAFPAVVNCIRVCFSNIMSPPIFMEPTPLPPNLKALYLLKPPEPNTRTLPPTLMFVEDELPINATAYELYTTSSNMVRS